ncbi:MAG: helix-hairpin-helix domain-containing protein [Myxococcota bacterium]
MLLLLALWLTTVSVVGLVVVGHPTEAVAQGRLVNINTADAVELARLPGVTLATAREIVKWRNDNGPFTAVEELLQVKRVTETVVGRIRDKIAFEDSEATASADDGGGGNLQRSSRMEFDARVVRGEAAGSGAVFLFERAPRPLPSMVARRTTWLDDTVEDVFGDEETLVEEEVPVDVARKGQKGSKKPTTKKATSTTTPKAPTKATPTKATPKKPGRKKRPRRRGRGR